MWCPSRFGSWSCTVYLVHHPSHYSYFITLLEPLCRRNTTFLLFLSIGFWLQHHSASRYLLGWLLIFLYSTLLKINFFFLLAYHNKLPKLVSSLITTHSARNLGFIFDEHLTFSDQISALSESCHYHIRELRCLRPCLNFKTASTIATSIVHSERDYCNLMYYNIPQSQIKIKSRTLLLMLSPERQNLLTSLLFSNLYTGSKQTNALNINFFLSYKVLTTNQPQYLHDLISVQQLSQHTFFIYGHSCSPTYPLLSISLIALFGMLHLFYGTNSPLIFASLVRHSLLHFHLSHMTVHHFRHLHYHRLHRSVFHSELKTWLLRKSSPEHFFLPDWFHGLSDHLIILLCSAAAFVCMVCWTKPALSRFSNALQINALSVQ